MANILYAKVGLKLPKAMWGGGQSGRSWSSGHDDDVRFLINVSYNNPDDTFYIIGASSFNEIKPAEKKRLFPYGNVVDAYNSAKYHDGNRPSTDIYQPIDEKGNFIDEWNIWDTENVRYRIPLEYLNDNGITPDYGIIAMSNLMSRNIYGKSRTKKGSIAKPLSVSKSYGAPVLHALNETGIRWVAMVDDPRCMHGAFDLFNNPPIVLSQINGSMTTSNMTSYEDDTVVEGEVDVIYAHVESTVVMDEIVKPVDEYWSKREKNISIALNGGMNNEEKDQLTYGKIFDARYTNLKEWILDPFEGVEVYGKWGEGVLADDDRFKGSINRDELHSVMSNWKHSLCIPIKSGWATTKYLELLKSGVSPFLHPNYDTQKNTKLQDFYRVESVDDLRDKIEKTSDDRHIEELNKAIDICLADEFTSGQYLNDIVYKYLGIDRTGRKNKNRELWEVKPPLGPTVTF